MTPGRRWAGRLAGVAAHAAAGGCAVVAVGAGLFVSAVGVFVVFNRDGVPQSDWRMRWFDWAVLAVVVLIASAAGTAAVAGVFGRRRLWTVLGVAVSVFLAAMLVLFVVSAPGMPYAARPANPP